MSFSDNPKELLLSRAIIMALAVVYLSYVDILASFFIQPATLYLALILFALFILLFNALKNSNLSNANPFLWTPAL